MKKSSKSESLESIMGKIDDIISELESGEKPLEDAVNSFREAVEYYKLARKKIEEAELTIAEITDDLEESDGPDKTDECGKSDIEDKEF